MINTIIVEDKLEEIFKYLSKVKNKNGDQFKCYFGAGDEFELKTFLKKKQNEAQTPYPLIWLIYPYLEEHARKEVSVENMILILAVNSSKELSNKERLESTYKNILIKVQNDVLNLLKLAVTTRFNGSFKSTKFPNYSDDLSLGEANFTSEIWDAIKLEFSITFNSACIKAIRTKNN